MSFFADIIADSRRKIRPAHRPVHHSGFSPGSLPVDIHAPEPFKAEPAKEGAIGNVENPHNETRITKSDITLPAASSRSQAQTTPLSTSSITHAAKKHATDLKDSLSSESAHARDVTVSRLSDTAAPTVQLKGVHKKQANTMSLKMDGYVDAGVNTDHDEIPRSVPPMVEAPFTRSKTALKKRHVRKHDDVVQAPAVNTKLPHETRSKTTIDQPDMVLEVADDGITGTTLRQEENKQRAEKSVASAVTAGVQVESSATHTRQVKSPVGSMGQSSDVSSKQPRVQIGQVNVVIEQAAPSRRRASAVAGNNDYASRNFLKSL